MTTIITTDLLVALHKAQMAYAHVMTAPENLRFLSDDGCASLETALVLGSLLTRMLSRNDLEELQELLDPTSDGFLPDRFSGCPDGACLEIYAAMPEGFAEIWWETQDYEASRNLLPACS